MNVDVSRLSALRMIALDWLVPSELDEGRPLPLGVRREGNRSILLISPLTEISLNLPASCTLVSLRSARNTARVLTFSNAALTLRGNVTRNQKLFSELSAAIELLTAALRWDIEVADLSTCSGQAVSFTAKSGIAALFSKARSEERRYITFDTSAPDRLSLHLAEVPPLQMKLPADLRNPRECLEAFNATGAS